MASSFHLTPFIFSLHGRRRASSSLHHICIHGSSSTSGYGHLSMSTSTKASNGPPQHMETEKERDIEKKQKQKKKKRKKENLQPSTSLEMGEDCNEDPLGRKELGKAVIPSLAESMSAMASELVVVEDKGELSDSDKRVVGTGLVVQKQKQKQKEKQKQKQKKKKEEEEDQNLQSSISSEMGEDCKEDPIGRQKLGKSVIPLLAKSMSAMASELAEAEEKGELSDSAKRVVGIVGTGIVVQKQKNKKKKKKEENLQSSISLEKGEDCKGDPMGRKELGKAVIPWLAEGMSAMASELVEAEEKGELSDSDKRVIGIVGTGLVVQAQPFLSKGEIPPGYEEQCMKASTHYPTLFDHFQRELRKALMASEQKGSLVDWQNSLSWRSLKKLAKSDGHRVVARKLPENMQLHEQLGVARYRITEIQGKIDAFVDHALQLLQSERDAETEATQMGLNASPEPKPALNDEKVTEYSENDDDEASHQEHCDTICNLQAISSSTGLGRLHLVTFRVRGGHRLPLTNISPGDMVCIRVVDRRGIGTAQRMQGLVHTFGEDGASITLSLEVCFGHMIFSKLIGKTFRIDRVYSLADPTTYERNVEALKRLQNRGLRKGSPAAAVVATLFGEGPDIVWLAQHNPLIGETTISAAAPTTTTSSDGNEVQDISTEGFDESQVRAIELGLRKDHPVMLIQGPPGTGKTKVVVKLIFEAATRGTRVLATAPTNAAVDVLVERLGALGLDVVRIGNPARLAPSVASKSLGAIVDSKISGFRREIARRRSDLRADLRQCLEDDDLATGIRQLIKELTRSLKEKEKNAIDETMASAQVVLATNIGSGEPLIQSLPPFDLAVIDEAGQAIEPSCWIPLLRCHRAILSGDPCQLAPTILSRQALEGGLGVSLMERAGSLHGGVLQTLLCMQYRMHDAIAQWSSKQMYGGLVTSSPSVALHSLADSPDVKATVITETPLLLLDTRRSLGSLLPGCEECFDPAGTGSFFNEGEADIVVAHVQALISCGVVASSIAVQSPYVSQVELLRNKIQEISEAKGIQVATIDSFQGREADAIIISLVRSNEMGAIGFLGDRRRLNVAVTRARKHVAIVCDSSTVSRNAFLLHLLQHVRDFGVVNTAGSIPPRPKQSLIASSK